MSELEARLIFRQIIFAIDYAHQRGVAHRDIKLENILITKKNRVKIADFGLSSYMKEGQFMNSFRGTIRYADPEILKKKDYSAEISDIWACGVVLYCLICGNMPFEDDILGQLFKKVVMCDYSLPDDIS